MPRFFMRACRVLSRRLHADDELSRRETVMPLYGAHCDPR